MNRILAVVGFLVLGCFRIVSGHQFLNDAEIWLFTGNNFDFHEVFHQEKAADIIKSPAFNPLWPTVLYIHGLNESPMEISVQVVINAYLAKKGYNTLLLDWQTLADSFYPKAVANVARLGTRLAYVLTMMFDAGIELDNFHLVGHSLGAQMAGYIGRNVQSMSNNARILPRITALDPAGPLFYPPMQTTAISATDAVFVDVIHTDAGFLGASLPTGTVDFWPNGGSRRQVGCPHGPLPPMGEDGNHSRSWRFWAESVLSSNPKTFAAVQAPDWQSFKDGIIDDSLVIAMVLTCPTNVTGMWYLSTNGESPYSRGKLGLYYKNK